MTEVTQPQGPQGQEFKPSFIPEASESSERDPELDRRIDVTASKLVGEALNPFATVEWDETQAGFTAEDWAEARTRAGAQMSGIHKAMSHNVATPGLAEEQRLEMIAANGQEDPETSKS